MVEPWFAHHRSLNGLLVPMKCLRTNRWLRTGADGADDLCCCGRVRTGRTGGRTGADGCGRVRTDGRVCGRDGRHGRDGRTYHGRTDGPIADGRTNPLWQTDKHFTTFKPRIICVCDNAIKSPYTMLRLVDECSSSSVTNLAVNAQRSLCT